VLIALIEQGAPVAGALDAPALGESYWAGERVFRATDRASMVGEPLNALPLVAQGRTAIVSSSHAREASLARCAQLGANQVFSESSAVKFARLAAGDADVYPREGKTMQWDVAAGDALLRPLGGGVLDPQGRLMRYGARAGSWENPPFVAWRSLPAAA
jgi:3'-phosphoadenosine 5'-phosphosulfate (PAPS) 3'-phosphatase